MKNREKRDKKTIRFLWASMIGILVLCIGVFVWITRYMSKESEETMEQVGEIYMSEVNRQMQLHFRSIVELRFSQMEGILLRTPPEKAESYGEEMIHDLSVSARVREFTYLGLYSRDGTLETVYGEPLEIINGGPFTEALSAGENKVAAWMTGNGDTLLVFGIPASYPMAEGKESLGIVAGVPMKGLNQTMSLSSAKALSFSHIIRKDGSFVLRNADVAEETYFQWILEETEFLDMTAEEGMNAMESAFQKGENFSSLLNIEEERYHVYCTPLPYSEWYLVSIMPYGPLDETVNELGVHRVAAILRGCGLILLALLFVFFSYYGMTRQQMKDLRRAMKEAERANRAKSEFLSNMSHDIRTPMNAIVGMTAIAEAHLDNMAQVKDCLRKIELSSRHLLGLINDVLDMAKIESGRLSLNAEVISLREIMEGLVGIIQPQVEAKELNFDIVPEHIRTEHVVCDSVRLNQVLLNLLSNAVKFTAESGRIEMAVRQEPSPSGDEYVRIHFYVKDTGIGMSPEFQKKIFESFAREDNKRVHRTEGTGLGMAITKYIIDQMGGTIEVKSEQNKGSEFHVALDLKAAADGASEQELDGKRVLFADGDSRVCQSAAELLASMGAKADWTADGREAIGMVERSCEEGRSYDVILLGWNLMEPDGTEMVKEIRSLTGSTVPVLLVSACGWSGAEAKAKEAGADGFIRKPLFRSALSAVILPLFNKEVQAAEVMEEAETAANIQGKRLLIAEDNELNWEIANELLTDCGFLLDWAENGKHCVEKFEASEPGYYAAVLMDIRMPVMDGYEAARAIRTSNRPDSGLPIIAMTADAFAEDVKKCLDCGMDAHVAKPLDIRNLAAVLERLI